MPPRSGCSQPTQPGVRCWTATRAGMVREAAAWARPAAFLSLAVTVAVLFVVLLAVAYAASVGLFPTHSAGGAVLDGDARGDGQGGGRVGPSRRLSQPGGDRGGALRRAVGRRLCRLGRAVPNPLSRGCGAGRRRARGWSGRRPRGPVPPPFSAWR